MLILNKSAYWNEKESIPIGFNQAILPFSLLCKIRELRRKLQLITLTGSIFYSSWQTFSIQAERCGFYFHLLLIYIMILFVCVEPRFFMSSIHCQQQRDSQLGFVDADGELQLNLYGSEVRLNHNLQIHDQTQDAIRPMFCPRAILLLHGCLIRLKLQGECPTGGMETSLLSTAENIYYWEKNVPWGCKRTAIQTVSAHVSGLFKKTTKVSEHVIPLTTKLNVSILHQYSN